ncbi:hypothetical protein [Tropicimonas sp. S265A]|uniref:hypothetical protein n=1 Tax=Tropicimonas sp. S265A TaxID=3415134 RepID=UPI003C7A1B90
MIQGYRTAFDMGPAASPLSQTDSSQNRRAEAEAKPQTAVQGADAASRTGLRDAETLRPTKAPAAASDVDQGKTTGRTDDTDSSLRAMEDVIQKNAPTYQEPTLPRLSAEALATALMTAEPDKALVPRVLPGVLTE